MNFITNFSTIIGPLYIDKQRNLSLIKIEHQSFLKKGWTAYRNVRRKTENLIIHLVQERNCKPLRNKKNISRTHDLRLEDLPVIIEA